MTRPAAQPTAVSAPESTLYGVPEGHDSRLLAARARMAAKTGALALHIVLDAGQAETMRGCLAFFAPDVDIVVFPAWNCLPYDRVSPSADIVAARVDALTILMARDRSRPCAVITTVNAISQKIMPRASLDRTMINLAPGQKLKLTVLQAYLETNGYIRSDTVRQSGEYAIRGGLVDLFPTGQGAPVRIDLFGDEIDAIKYFDADHQRTTGECRGLTLKPAEEYFLDDDSIARFRAGYRDLFGAVSNDPVYEAVSEKRRIGGLDHWLPLFHDNMETLFDYCGDDALLSSAQGVGAALSDRLTQVADFHDQRAQILASENKGRRALAGSSYRPVPPGRLYLSAVEAAALPARVGATTWSHFAKPDGADGHDEQGRRSRDFADVRASASGNVLKAGIEYLDTLRAPRRVCGFLAGSAGSAQRLQTMFEAVGLTGIVHCPDYAALSALAPDQTGIAVLPLDHGFVTDDLALVSEQDLFGDKLIRKSRKARKSDHFLTEITSLSPGDLIVHVDHGIGRFEGLETVRAAGSDHDCLCLTYLGGDRLFVPVENIELVTRFGHDEGLVPLDKLGSSHWQARKARIKKDLMAMAGQLLDIAAQRATREGERFVTTDTRYHEFVARFPYQETDDQQNAIDDVLADLASGRPMDRLVCGDVGFGKTEVALRAAYVVSAAGQQVAVIGPTTLLARQHYQGFSRRFEGFGVRIGHLSRLAPAREMKQDKDGMADGSVSIAIGTHALLGPQVKFANLGLVIVDEEQRFGVKQKERLKELQANVHVLTLTATPIPRTLQMALTGVRDMSIMASPPLDRLAVRTSVMPYDAFIVREALMRERYRGGQSFYVVPRIKDLADVQDRLQQLVPDLKIIVAHGQMAASDLEARMTAFYDGAYDILLATNIIESGLDIPRANTIIIHRADMFGLAQLYQLRGRVGRAKARAYAYLTYDASVRPNAVAQKRLEVLETLDTLGSGFQLASHDMDIRGSGNLLGDAQSGHIKEVGIELYQQMLEDAVAAARMQGQAGKTAPGTPDAFTPSINIGLSLMIPEAYVPDLSVRMALYRRLGDIKDEEGRNSFAAELIDRFGALPPETENLLKVSAIKHACIALRIDRLDAGPKGAVIGFKDSKPAKPEAVFKWMDTRKGAVSVRPDQRISIIGNWGDAKARLAAVEKILSDLATI